MIVVTKSWVRHAHVHRLAHREVLDARSSSSAI